MPLMLEVSDEVRAHIGDEEADRLLAGENAPDTYDCTSCRNPGDIAREPTSTVLFVGEETAVLAFAHASCVRSQVVAVSEDEIRGAVRNITRSQVPIPAGAPAQGGHHTPTPQVTVPPAAPAQAAHSPAAPEVPYPSADPSAQAPAVLGITCGLVLVGGSGHPALVVEPTGPVGRPGTPVGEDEFLPLLVEQGFLPVRDVEQSLTDLPGWSVVLVGGELHAVLQPSASGQTTWWQAHQPLPVTDEWRRVAIRLNRVLLYAAPAGSIGRQPREDLLRDALEKAAAEGVLVGAALPLAGT